MASGNGQHAHHDQYDRRAQTAGEKVGVRRQPAVPVAADGDHRHGRHQEHGRKHADRLLECALHRWLSTAVESVVSRALRGLLAFVTRAGLGHSVVLGVSQRSARDKCISRGCHLRPDFGRDTKSPTGDSSMETMAGSTPGPELHR
ncbi:hypothetical protein MTO96_013593 [Rhipicephalus appendiculatus]